MAQKTQERARRQQGMTTQMVPRNKNPPTINSCQLNAGLFDSEVSDVAAEELQTEELLGNKTLM